MRGKEAPTNVQEEGDAVLPQRPRDETARLGKEIYERDIRHLVEADHQGEVIAIDVGSGSYALGENAIAASESLRDQRPNAQVWLMRVGHRTLYRFGGGFAAEVRVIEGSVSANLEAVIPLPLQGPTGLTQ